MDFSKELQKLILDTLKTKLKDTKDIVKSTKVRANINKSNLNTFIDSSTKPMGFSKITKKGFTP